MSSEEVLCLADLAVFHRSALKAAAGASNSDKHLPFSVSG